MPLNDNDLLLINDSQDSNEAKKIKYSTLKSNINGDAGNNLQEVTDNGNTTTNGATFGAQVGVLSLASDFSIITSNQGANQGIFVGSTDTSTPTTANSNIHLKGDGSATFGGEVQIGGNGGAGTEQGAKFFNNGNLHITRTKAADALIQGYTEGNSTETFIVTADGSASFAGTVMYSNGVDTSSQLTPLGVTAQRDTADSGKSVWRGFGGNTLTSEIYSDGSASFGSVNSLEIAPNDTQALYVYNSGNKARINWDGSANFGETNISLNADGSASFASTVTVGDWLSGTTDWGARLGGLGHKFRANSSTATIADFFGGTGGISQNGTILRVKGDELQIGGYSAAGPTPAWRTKFKSDGSLSIGGVQTDSTDNPNIKLEENGSATFAGTVETQNLKLADGNGTLYNDTGNVFIRSGTGGDIRFNVNGSTTPDTNSVAFRADGSASFSGGITTGSTIIVNNNPISNSGEGLAVFTSGNSAWRVANPASSVFECFSGNNANPSITFLGNGSATFTGNVTAPNVFFSAPDGSTYDIRERIEEAITRVTAIETADISDDQEHSALLTLIANMSTRITALEAQLAGGN